VIGASSIDTGPTTTSDAPVNLGSDGASCFSAAGPGSLVLNTQNAGGPMFTSTACRSIHLKLTGATYVTYARSCLQNASGSAVTSCSGWVRLSYPDTWDTLSQDVPDGTRWRLDMYSDGAETATYMFAY
jgi:hypothetical protein